MSKIAAVARLTANEGKRDELVAVLRELVDCVADEDGTLVYVMHESVQDPNVVLFYELYADQAAFEAHGKSDTMKAVGPKLAGLLAAMPDISIHTPIAGKGL